MAETRNTAPVGAKQDVVVQGKPLNDKTAGTISVTYRPGPGDPEETEVFGKKVKAGESVEVPAQYADKARGNPYLAVDGEKTYGDEDKKAKPPEEQDEASFEENLARERSAEYLEGNAALPPAPPGENDRLTRAMQQAAELKAAAESDDKDKPRRGRPPKDA